jgi:hypothetical protein
MAGFDPAIQGHTKSFAMLLWMAASEGGHDEMDRNHPSFFKNCPNCKSPSGQGPWPEVQLM